MKPDKDVFRINGIRERDIDLLFLEELGSSSSFCTSFLESTGHSPGLKPEKVEVSVVGTDGRESDLVVWFKENDLTWIFLIENKIDAQMQKKQAEDYRKRGKNYVDEGEADDYRIVLSAPNGYIEENESQAKKFDHIICYEDMLEWIKASDIPADRKSCKLSLLRTAINKQGEREGDWGVKNPSEVVTKFWDDYWKLVREIAPEFTMRKPGEKGWKSTFFYFNRAKGLPGDATLVHKIRNWPQKKEQSEEDYFDIQFNRTNCEQLKARYGDKLQVGIDNDTIHFTTKIQQADASASIRVSLPTLNIERDLEQQKENCKIAIQRGKELLNFFGER